MEAAHWHVGALLGCWLLLFTGCGDISSSGDGSVSAGNGGATTQTPDDASSTASVTGRVQLLGATTITQLPSASDGAADLIDEPGLDQVVPGELVVQFDESASASARECVLRDHGMQEIESSPSGLCRVATGSKTTGDSRRAKAITLDRASSLRGRPGILHVGPNQRRYIARVPNDRYFPSQWQYGLINLPAAWDLTTGSDDIIVAVVDTGILSEHPDLQERLVPGYDFIADRTSAGDGDGRDADPEDAGDQFDGPGQSSFHGTHVAGTIGASTDNLGGVAGVTWRTKIMPVRALGIGGGTTFDVAEAIRFAAGLPNITGKLPARPARIINLSVASIAGSAPSSEEAAAIAAATQAGVLVIAAAGNDGSSLPAYPAATPDAVSVGAVDIQGNRAAYSNSGSTLDLMAPGGEVGTDLNGDGFIDSILSTGGSDAGGAITYRYVFNNGTSMAAPQVSGVAALVLAANPALNAAELRSVLETTARDLGANGHDDEYGSGLIDAAAAVREAFRRGGQSIGSTPALALSTGTLDFGARYGEFRVRISNTGGGYLALSSVGIQTATGSGWLQARMNGTLANANAAEIIISVNRTNLAQGTYTGTVMVNADGLAPAPIQVSMSVGWASGLGEVVYVVAIPAGLAVPVAQDETSAAEGFAFALRNLGTGDYLIYAGTDRNDDGYICDAGDMCGSLGSIAQPLMVHLDPQQEYENADFVLSESAPDGGGRAATPQLHLPRLR